MKNNLIDRCEYARKQNEIIIKALCLTDEELNNLKDSFCYYGLDIFRGDFNWRVKLRALLNERYDEIFDLISQKFSIRRNEDLDYFIRKRCFKIVNNEPLENYANQLTLF